MEILDLYDRDLKPTGQTIERGKRVPPGLISPLLPSELILYRHLYKGIRNESTLPLLERPEQSKDVSLPVCQNIQYTSNSYSLNC